MTETRRDDDAAMVRCPVSGSQNVLPLCSVDGHQIYRCPDSATDFVHPMPDPAGLKRLYDDPAWFTGGLRGGYRDYDAQTAPSVEKIREYLDRFPDGGRGRSILDIGCGYGSHLRMAADRGWSCFGVEPSLHARNVAAERHGRGILIVEKAEELLPRHYDLILMLDVIEHLPDPYTLFFTLFGRGAISPDTLVVISTPNARSFDALQDPAGWIYRHPPSHLVFYSAKSFEILARRLLFSESRSQGVVATQAREGAGFADEGLDVQTGHFDGLGLLVELSGSNFTKFMHERYVPGGFWPLTEYEHLPRYSFAADFAAGGRVLDLGCGTGYGASSLADAAESVLGIDISADAIRWARDWHQKPRLEFEVRDDLGAGLPAASFDLVTNFEMIEHVDAETQIQAIKTVRNLLKPGGKLVISTPDPEHTAPYGVNPYHLRELTLDEFRALLEPYFEYVKIMRQWVRPSILIGEHPLPEETVAARLGALGKGEHDSMVGYVAVCSNQPFETPPYFCRFDTNRDFNVSTLKAEHASNERSLQIKVLSAEKDLVEQDLNRTREVLAGTRSWVDQLNAEIQRISAELERAMAEKTALQDEKTALQDKLEAVNQSFGGRVARLLGSSKEN